jgi:hypothetical protein
LRVAPPDRASTEWTRSVASRSSVVASTICFDEMASRARPGAGAPDCGGRGRGIDTAIAVARSLGHVRRDVGWSAFFGGRAVVGEQPRRGPHRDEMPSIGNGDSNNAPRRQPPVLLRHRSTSDRHGGRLVANRATVRAALRRSGVERHQQLVAARVTELSLVIEPVEVEQVRPTWPSSLRRCSMRSSCRQHLPVRQAGQRSCSA